MGLIPLEEWRGFREELDEDFQKESDHVITDVAHICFDILIFTSSTTQVVAYMIVYFKSSKQIKSMPYGFQPALRNRVKFVNTLMTIMLVQLIFSVPMLILAYAHYKNIEVWKVFSEIGPPIWDGVSGMMPCESLRKYEHELKIYDRFSMISWIAKAIQYARCMVDPTVHTLRKPEIRKIMKQILLKPFCCCRKEVPMSRRKKSSMLALKKMYGENAVFVIRF